jgi:radial spoke head protein 3
MPTNQPSSYTHTTMPAAVKPAQSKYRENEEVAPLSLMSDPRVVRGSTTALARKIIAKGKEKQKTATLRLKSATSALNEDYNRPQGRPSYIFDVPDFAASELDINQYLTDGIDPEERKKNMIVKVSQTDEFLDKPPSPKYVPRKTGRDQDTQVEDVRDLFDFDVEVAPMLEVIVSKTIEQAISEVQEEEELLRIEKEINVFKAQKAVEEQWMKETEQATKDKIMEKVKIVEEAAIRNKIENDLRARVAGRQMVTEIYENILAEIEQELWGIGTWEKQQIEKDVGEQIIAETKAKVELHATASSVLDDILTEAQTLYIDRVEEYVPIEKSATLKIIIKPQEMEGGEEGGDGAENPPTIEISLAICSKDTILDLEKRARSAMTEKEITQPISLLQFFCDTANRTIAKDAYLLNFNMPANMEYVMRRE